MSKKIRWGIAGTGYIAHKFAMGLSILENAEVIAVCSRNIESAEAFAKEHTIPHAHGSYEALAQDEEVDVVYVATLHPRHMADSILFLKNKKGVLCEKPFTMDAKELREIYACAKEMQMPLMEGMWTRFLPAMGKVRALLQSKVIGEVTILLIDFGFMADWNPTSRILDKKLGGGSVLDVGAYVAAFASMVLGKQPDEIKALTHIGTTGIDERTAFIFGYKTGELANIICSVRTETPQLAVIAGTNGRITIPNFWCAEELTLSITGQADQKFEFPFEGNGFNYEAESFMEMLEQGHLENPLMTVKESIEIMETLDQIRAQVGICYDLK